MGGGNPIKKAGKAIDKTGNALEKAGKQTRDEATRNMGADGKKYTEAVLSVPENVAKRTAGAVEDISKGNFGKGGKTLAMEYTGIPEISDLKDAYGGMAKDATPDLPAITDSPDTNTPTPEEAAKKVADDVEMQGQLESSRRKGRASTVLTGSQGLGGSNTYSARKTLLGA